MLVAVAYSILGFLGILFGEPTTGFSLVLTVAIYAGSIPVIAAWSVFGPESYLKRFWVSHSYGIIIGAGGVLALLILSAGYGPPSIQIILGALLLVAPISVSAQLPFWFCRIVFGWQFTSPDTPPRSAYDLKDLFQLTFLAALAVSSPAMLANLDYTFNSDRYTGLREIAVDSDDLTSTTPLPDDQTAIPTRYRVDHERYQSTLVAIGWGVFSSCVGVFIGCALSVFVVYHAAKPGDINSAYASVSALTFILVIWVIGFAGVMFGAGADVGPFLITGTCTNFLTVAVTFFPLALLRKESWSLTSTRGYQQQMAVAVETETSKKE